ncbi:hypothetical protein CAOG_005684 [Capsaspora owczarzaki ATCC 30864]|uniref:C2 DOCK-type domain-containing protein n=1 Tax=Capsaspora owczarzaki (strain ATCC 30864) TaxID=595528 RepID=A0A0D2WTX7_CAPO3|nr:hypothetical protein CAOG_005684 [Capsaspora owczarzaki ATCC 30864]
MSQSIRVLLLGDPKLRKELAAAYLKLASFSNAGSHSHKKHVKIEGETCLVEVVETADQSNKAEEVDIAAIRQADAFLVVARDVVRGSFPNVVAYRNRINAVKEDDEDIPIIVVGNVRDGALTNPIVSEALCVPFLDINIATNKHIDECFTEACVRTLKQRRLKHAVEAADKRGVLDAIKQNIKRTYGKGDHSASREALSSHGSMERLPTIDSFNFHLLFQFEALVCAVGTDCEIYFSLYDKQRNVVFTEPFMLPLTSLGMPSRDRTAALFSYITNAPVNDLFWTRHTWLLCKIVKLVNTCDGPAIRKPFGMATIPLSEVVKAQRDHSGNSFTLAIHLCGKDKEFMQTPASICKKSKFPSAASETDTAGGTTLGNVGMSASVQGTVRQAHKAPVHGDGFVLATLQLFKGESAAVMQDHKTDMLGGKIQLVHCIGHVAYRSPFHPPPNIAVSGQTAALVLASHDPRPPTNELYVSLLRGDFHSDDLRRGVEVTFHLLRETGDPSPNSRFLPTDATYKSVVYSSTLHPAWHETFRASIPVIEYKRTHLLMVVRDCSERDKFKTSGLTVGYCFLPLNHRDPHSQKLLPVADGQYQCVLHRLEHQVGKPYSLKMRSLAEGEETPAPQKNDSLFVSIMLSTRENESHKGTLPAPVKSSDYAVVSDALSASSAGTAASALYAQPSDSRPKLPPRPGDAPEAVAPPTSAKPAVSAEYQVPQKNHAVLAAPKPSAAGSGNNRAAIVFDETASNLDQPPAIPERTRSPRLTSPPPPPAAAPAAGSVAIGANPNPIYVQPPLPPRKDKTVSDGPPKLPIPYSQSVVESLTRQQLLGHDLDMLSTDKLTLLLRELDAALERTKAVLIQKSRAEKPSA